MLRRLFALTTLFSIYIFPASVRATITPIQINYEKVGMPKEETKSFSKAANAVKAIASNTPITAITNTAISASPEPAIQGNPDTKNKDPLENQSPG